jgi:hypothetical protein
MSDLLMRGGKYHAPDRRAVVAMASDFFDA